MWRESQRIKARHAILGGCVTAIALCAIGGFLLLFGSQLLLGVFVGGLAAIFQDRAGSVTLRQLFGLDPTPAPPTDPAAGAAPPVAVWAGPLGVAAAAAVALVCVVAGIFFAGLGTIRALEGVGNFTDYFCSRPCAVVKGLWIHGLSVDSNQLVLNWTPFVGDTAEIPLGCCPSFALASPQ